MENRLKKERSLNLYLVILLTMLLFLTLLPGKVLSQNDELLEETFVSPFVSHPRRALVAPELDSADVKWIERSLGWADYIFDTFPPAWPEHPVRRAALIRLDDIFHILSAPKIKSVQNFYHKRMEKVISQIETTNVTDGIYIWKLYNSGFIIRTPTVTYAHDIYRGPPAEGFAVSDELIKRLVDQADCMFISHEHGDHADPAVVKMFLDQNKPVVACTGMWQNTEAILSRINSSGADPKRVEMYKHYLQMASELTAKIIYPERSDTLKHELKIQEGKQTLTYMAYPGHQANDFYEFHDTKTLNNNFLVITPEGYITMQTGDQRNSDDFSWIMNISEQHQNNIDVLLPSCWTLDIKRLARGVNPKLIITAHENEMGHGITNRRDYTRSYNYLHGTNYAYLIMTWGEGYFYKRK